MSAGRRTTGTNQTWGTPRKYVDAVRAVFGGDIQLDPCSNEFSIVRARVEYRLPDNDGLKDSWGFSSIYCNPPYGRDSSRRTSIRDWLKRCSEAHDAGSEVLALIPVASNTGHWKNYVFGCATSVCFLGDTRLKFLLDGKEQGKGASMACAMVYWGNNPDKFDSIFRCFGTVLRLQEDES